MKKTRAAIDLATIASILQWIGENSLTLAGIMVSLASMLLTVVVAAVTIWLAFGADTRLDDLAKIGMANGGKLNILIDRIAPEYLKKLEKNPTNEPAIPEE